ncbi:hypothetical protein DRJ25_04595 [Candidatus Woesearchaeota archaeon]|nr:MAG: hypothetical protein DRJ25_04595 [Candidatus Woesearchaeota archaeon]
MGLIEKITSLLNKKKPFTFEELEEILKNKDFKQKKDEITKIILENLGYPNINALRMAEQIPDKKYEDQLLSYNETEMTDPQKIYWMFALAEIKSEKGFERIKEYTKTNLFHQAFISMSKIDLEQTMKYFDKFLDERCEKYNPKKINTRHESGYYTLLEIFNLHPDKKKEILDCIDTTNKDLKSGLIYDAVEQVKKEDSQQS